MVAAEIWGLRAAAGVFFGARHRDLGGDAGGEEELDCLAVLVDGDRLGAGGVGDGFGDLERVAFDHEVEVADTEAGQHVAHGASGEEHVDVGFRRRGLHVLNHPVLIRTQVAFQHVDVVAHRMRSLLSQSRPHAVPTAQARG